MKEVLDIATVHSTVTDRLSSVAGCFTKNVKGCLRQ